MALPWEAPRDPRSGAGESSAPMRARSLTDCATMSQVWATESHHSSATSPAVRSHSRASSAAWGIGRSPGPIRSSTRSAIAAAVAERCRRDREVVHRGDIEPLLRLFAVAGCVPGLKAFVMPRFPPRGTGVCPLSNTGGHARPPGAERDPRRGLPFSTRHHPPTFTVGCSSVPDEPPRHGHRYRPARPSVAPASTTGVRGRPPRSGRRVARQRGDCRRRAGEGACPPGIIGSPLSAHTHAEVHRACIPSTA